MEFTEFGVFVDIAFIGLLVAVLIYAIRLNRHISALHNNKAELEKLLGGFVASTERAEEAIQKVKRHTQENIEAVQEAVGKAETLRADLSYMLDRGEEIANRLEEGIRAGRTAYQAGKGGIGGAAQPSSAQPGSEGREAPELRAKPADRNSENGEIKAKSKADLLKALQGMR